MQNFPKFCEKSSCGFFPLIIAWKTYSFVKCLVYDYMSWVLDNIRFLIEMGI